jgi:purine-binding chemotaxis protein CheW
MSRQEKQFATFYLADRLYGIDVMKVQEITSNLPLTAIRLAPNSVRGLINLRGQIATAVGLRELLGIESRKDEGDDMAVVCKMESHLISLQVDRIGDVIPVVESDFEPTPITISGQVKKFVKGVYKIDGSILSAIEIESVFSELTLENSK